MALLQTYYLFAVRSALAKGQMPTPQELDALLGEIEQNLQVLNRELDRAQSRRSTAA